MCIFTDLERHHVDHLNKHFSSFYFVVECGDEITFATDDQDLAFEEAEKVAGVMAAHIYKRGSKGFSLFVTFHADETAPITQEQIETIAKMLNGK